MRFTVAICTWRRPHRLRRTLDRLAQLDVSGFEWEVLVIDNEGDEGTRAAVVDMAARLPVRYVVEPRLGVSHARNTAVRSARGSWIAWTDDDVLVDRDWLQAHARGIGRSPAAVFGGGPIRPVFEAPPPAWVTANWARLADAYAMRDFGSQPFTFDVRRVPYGANLVIRADVQARYPYDIALGSRGTDGVRGEETTMIRALVSDGGLGCWVPDAIVGHVIPPERLTVEYVRSYYVGLGMADRVRRGTAHLPGCAPWHWQLALDLERAYRTARSSEPPEVWLPKLVDAAIARGRCLTRPPAD